MSNLILNIRYGTKHLQIRRNPFKIEIITNQYYLANKPLKKFAIYNIGNWYLK